MKAIIGSLLAVVLLGSTSLVGAQRDRPRLDDRPKLRDLKREGDWWFLHQRRLRNRWGYDATGPRLDDRPTLRDLKKGNEGNLPETGRLRDSRSYYEDVPRLDDRPLRSETQALGGGSPEQAGYQRPWAGQDALPEPVTTMPPMVGDMGSVCVACGDRPIDTTVQPVMWNDVVYVAAVDYFAALGAQVYYDQTNKAALAHMPDQTWVTLPLGQSYIYVGQSPRTLSRPTAVANGILMVPLRALSDQLGLQVRWDAETSRAILYPPEEPAAGTEEVAPAPGEEAAETPATP